MLGIEEARNLPAHKATLGGSRRKPRMVDLAAIEQLERDDCIERWRQIFGVMPPKYTSLEFMRKALAYETQAKTFGGHSNAVQRALKASLKAVRSEFGAENSADTNFDARAPTAAASALCAEPHGVIDGSASYAHRTIRHRNNSAPDACDQTGITGRGITDLSVAPQTRGKAEATTFTKPTRTLKAPKPSVISIRAGTHLVREWNGRTYQVEALDKGFRLDGKTYRSLSAIAKKITGAHWSGPRFFGLES